MPNESTPQNLISYRYMDVEYAQTASVFPQPQVAYDAMRDFATRCDARKSGRCKSCAFLLKALDEIALLHQLINATRVTVTVGSTPGTTSHV